MINLDQDELMSNSLHFPYTLTCFLNSSMKNLLNRMKLVFHSDHPIVTASELR